MSNVAEEPERRGLDDQPGDEWDDGDVFGRTRASRAQGHAINAGLPEQLPGWLTGLRPRAEQWPRPARRGRPRGPATAVDWRSTLKRWARQGHSDSGLMWDRAPRGPGRVVILWDVSGSMAAYVGWYFPWLYQLASAFASVTVFGFGTELADLTPHLRQSYRHAVSTLYRDTALWGSGTAIGEVFQQWNQTYGQELLGNYTTVVIISDGWDVGSPAQLEQAMQYMASRSRQIIWVNPLMVTTGFEPRTRALMAARHYARQMVAGATPAEMRRLSWQWGLS